MGWGSGNLGGGGSGLDFRVLDGLEQPASPRENDIWVACEGMTGWLFSATEPESPSEGMVWIAVGRYSSAAFNAAKRNTLMVYPLKASQYIGGAWQTKAAKSYHDGEWVDWTVRLYDNGVRSGAYGWAEKKTPSTAQIKYEDSRIKIATVGQQISEVYVVSGPIDLTHRSKISVTGNFGLASDSEYRNIATVFVATTANASYKNAAAISDYFTATSANLPAGYEYNVELDVSELTGYCYVFAGTNTQGAAWYAQRTNYITKILLE